MKRRFAQFIGTITLSGTLLGGSYTALAQDTNKEVRREAKQETKRKKAAEKIDRWALRQESKMIKRLVKERKFDTSSTARGSEVGFQDSSGQYITLGYFDKNNSFRSYAKKNE